MKIAIIGGGASGLITAYLLRHQHQTVVFEQASTLGGHIQTINGNVQGQNIPEGVRAENGVLGFDMTTYPTFRALTEDLSLEMSAYPMHAGYFFSQGYYFVTPSKHQRVLDNRWQRFRNLARLIKSYPSHKGLVDRINSFSPSELEGRPTRDFVPDIDEPCHRALWAAFMLAFSIPYSSVGETPAEITVAYMQGRNLPNWHILKDGVYSYIEKLLNHMPDGHQQRCNTPIERVSRTSKGVLVKPQNGAEEAFDRVVFATTPDCVLELLADATEAEQRRFGEWRARKFTTVAHTDESIYQPYGTQTYGPCDYFALQDERRFGYNSHINNGYGLGNETLYNFSYNLEDVISPNKIIHTAHHITPKYTLDALRHRKEIIATNGENNTFYAGAYLGNALHEGAASSANEVSRILKGQVLA